MPPATTVEHAASVLGAGYRISAQDTVPFCLWSASRFLDSFEDAMWNTVSALGDRDTTCAIVGGIVVLSGGLQSIPERWLASREGLPIAFKPRSR
jgi:ADP-ribosylglycohydrolase